MLDASQEKQYLEMIDFLSSPEKTFSVQKIHPFDMYVMLSSGGYNGCPVSMGQLYLLDGKVWLETTCIPAETKEGKDMYETVKENGQEVSHAAPIA